MEVTVQDRNDKNIVASIIPHNDNDDAQQISILETYGETEIVLDLRAARRLGSALKLLAQVAGREDEEWQAKMDQGAPTAGDDES